MGKLQEGVALTRQQAIEIFFKAINHDDPYWIDLVEDYSIFTGYDKLIAWPSQYDMGRALGFTNEEMETAEGLEKGHLIDVIHAALLTPEKLGEEIERLKVQLVEITEMALGQARTLIEKDKRIVKLEARGIPEAFEMPTFSTIDRSSLNYKAGWNAYRKTMIATNKEERDD